MNLDPFASSELIRVLVVDDHPIVRQGLTLLFAQQENIQVCAEAEDADQALEQIESARPDLAIIDISLKTSNGLDLIKLIRERYDLLPVLVLSVHDESLYAERALRAGARGYIMKEELTDNVIAAVQQIMQGKIYLSPTMSEKMLDRLSDHASQSDESLVQLLSDRELEVFRMIGEGQNTKEIAEKMNVSIKTIQSYRARIKEKLNLSSSSDLLKIALSRFSGK
ncbi:MAG: response regulator transcription factor [Candidatus Omnitrophica bacterium]|nr:response regulator transcription factor [Candidatus Omnitrophota bacterium]